MFSQNSNKVVMNRQIIKRPMEPYSKYYNCKRLLSKNSLAESYLAVNLESGHRCFIKLLSHESRIDKKSAAEVLINSYRLQKPLRTSKINTARKMRNTQGTIIVEYPLLDRLNWDIFDERSFWKYFPQSIVDISLIVDYIHLFDRVHCDLKLGNFQINSSGDHPKIILTDLDFLVKSGSSPNAKIFGTPERIAPEILRNETIELVSDNYSIGVLLSNCLEYYENIISELPLVDEVLSGIEEFAKLLTSPNPLLRSRLLIDGLKRFRIISDNLLGSLKAVGGRLKYSHILKNGILFPITE